MTHASRILNLRRRAAAFLLPTLPAAVAMAAYAHGHGGLSGEGLGVIVFAAIGAGTITALRLVSRIRAPQAVVSEMQPVAQLFRRYGS